MRERPNRMVSKTIVAQVTVGSNPTPSAHHGPLVGALSTRGFAARVRVRHQLRERPCQGSPHVTDSPYRRVAPTGTVACRCVTNDTRGQSNVAKLDRAVRFLGA